MEATRDFIPEGDEHRYPAQGLSHPRDFVKGTAQELLTAERAAIEKAVKQGLRGECDLEAWDKAHPEHKEPVRKTRKAKGKPLAAVPIKPEDEAPELERLVDPLPEPAPDPYAFGDDEEDDDGDADE